MWCVCVAMFVGISSQSAETIKTWNGTRNVGENEANSEEKEWKETKWRKRRGVYVKLGAIKGGMLMTNSLIVHIQK